MAMKLPTIEGLEQTNHARNFYNALADHISDYDIDMEDFFTRLSIKYPDSVMASSVKALKRTEPGPSQVDKFKKEMIRLLVPPAIFQEAVKEFHVPLYMFTCQYLKDNPIPSPNANHSTTQIIKGMLYI